MWNWIFSALWNWNWWPRWGAVVTWWSCAVCLGFMSSGKIKIVFFLQFKFSFHNHNARINKRRLIRNGLMLHYYGHLAPPPKNKIANFKTAEFWWSLQDYLDVKLSGLCIIWMSSGCQISWMSLCKNHNEVDVVSKAARRREMKESKKYQEFPRMKRCHQVTENYILHICILIKRSYFFYMKLYQFVLYCLFSAIWR